MIQILPHPLLDVQAFVTEFPNSLAESLTPPELASLLAPHAVAPLQSSDAVRDAVRDLLRHGGFKPTGRSKPASEYLLKAVAEESLSSINLSVDACNAISLHSGLPISVVDLDKAKEPFQIGIASEGANYIFNASGQVIDLSGLLCLFDAEGPCANAVKDAQRTKTDNATRRTLSVIWGTKALPNRTMETEAWYRQVLEVAGAATSPISLS